MRLKVPFEIVEVVGEKYAVPMGDCGPQFSGVVKLTGTAAAIIELLKEETDEESIVENMSRRYDVTRDVLAADVHRVVTKLEAKGLLA